MTYCVVKPRSLDELTILQVLAYRRTDPRLPSKLKATPTNPTCKLYYARIVWWLMTTTFTRARTSAYVFSTYLQRAHLMCIMRRYRGFTYCPHRKYLDVDIRHLQDCIHTMAYSWRFADAPIITRFVHVVWNN